jgi:hypothetical protein
MCLLIRYGVDLQLCRYDCNFFNFLIKFVLFLSSFQIETEAKPVTNQKNSGRCWIFATLNVIRIPFMKQHNLEEFEFSQAYLFFWDKVSFCM